MDPKYIIVIFLVAIVAALGGAMYFLVNDESKSKRMAWALTLRISLSFALILFLVIGYRFGWIQPHGVTP